MANVALFLASPLSDYVNGVILPVERRRGSALKALVLNSPLALAVCDIPDPRRARDRAR